LGRRVRRGKEKEVVVVKKPSLQTPHAPPRVEKSVLELQTS